MTRDAYWTKLARVGKEGAGEAGALPGWGGTPPVISTGADRREAERRNLPAMGTRFLRSLRNKSGGPVEMTRGGGTDPAPAATTVPLPIRAGRPPVK